MKKCYYISNLSNDTGMTEDNVYKVLYHLKLITKQDDWCKRLYNKKYVGKTKDDELYVTKIGYDYIIQMLMDNYIHSRCTDNNDNGKKYTLLFNKMVKEGYEPPKNKIKHVVKSSMITLLL